MPIKANWTEEEIRALAEYKKQGKDYQTIADAMGRTYSSVKRKWEKIHKRGLDTKVIERKTAGEVVIPRAEPDKSFSADRLMWDVRRKLSMADDILKEGDDILGRIDSALGKAKSIKKKL